MIYSIDRRIKAVVDARDMVASMAAYAPRTCPKSNKRIEKLMEQVDVLDEAIDTLKRYRNQLDL